MDLIATTAASPLVGRYGKHSGATCAEYQGRLPGDEVVPHPDLKIASAISIRAPNNLPGEQPRIDLKDKKRKLSTYPLDQ